MLQWFGANSWEKLWGRFETFWNDPSLIGVAKIPWAIYFVPPFNKYWRCITQFALLTTVCSCCYLCICCISCGVLRCLGMPLLWLSWVVLVKGYRLRHRGFHYKAGQATQHRIVHKNRNHTSIFDFSLFSLVWMSYFQVHVSISAIEALSSLLRRHRSTLRILRTIWQVTCPLGYYSARGFSDKLCIVQGCLLNNYKRVCQSHWHMD